MDNILKIAIVGDNLIYFLDSISQIKNNFKNQIIMPIDSNHLPKDIIFEEYWLNFDMVFYLGNELSNKFDIEKWLGHNHFVFVNTNSDDLVNSISEEINFSLKNIELEKKLLISMPNIDDLIAKYPIYKCHIEQTYLLCGNGSHRVRKRVSNGYTSYYETLKLRITNCKCNEFEDVLTQAQYLDLLKSKDPNKSTIIKDRYLLLYEGNRFELDIYDFWDDKATIELEIPSENYEYHLPPELNLIKDVSNDVEYKNNYLASLNYENSKA